MVLGLRNMPNKLKVFIIAGEVSGDVLGAGIMKEMPDAEFFGVGGENMIKQGLNSLFPMADLAVMGIVEVLGHAKTLLKRIQETVDKIIELKPDVVLTIDSPGFAKSVVKKLRDTEEGKKLIANGLRFHHFVAPQVWAWRSGRAKKYAKIFDKLYAFFDFEVPYFTKYGLDTIAVGHPLADKLVGKYRSSGTDSKIVSLVPGSRMSEVKKLLPVFRQVAERLLAGGYNYEFVIPVVETTKDYIQNEIKNWDFVPTLISADKRYELYSKTYIAIVASGTVSAELAMLHVPAIVVYKMNAVTTWLAKRLIKVNWVSLVNILMNKTIYPEFLGNNAKPEYILDAVVQLAIPSVRNQMLDELKQADSLWKKGGLSSSALIAADLRNLAK